MREKIRLPADVEFSTKFLEGDDGQGTIDISIESVPAGRFKKVTKVVISISSLGEVITITPKERRPLGQ